MQLPFRQRADQQAHPTLEDDRICAPCPKDFDNDASCYSAFDMPIASFGCSPNGRQVYVGTTTAGVIEWDVERARGKQFNSMEFV